MQGVAGKQQGSCEDGTPVPVMGLGQGATDGGQGGLTSAGPRGQKLQGYEDGEGWNPGQRGGSQQAEALDPPPAWPVGQPHCGAPRPTQHYPCSHFQESQSFLDIFS